MKILAFKAQIGNISNSTKYTECTLVETWWDQNFWVGALVNDQKILIGGMSNRTHWRWRAWGRPHMTLKFLAWAMNGANGGAIHQAWERGWGIDWLPLLINWVQKWSSNKYNFVFSSLLICFYLKVSCYK